MKNLTFKKLLTSFSLVFLLNACVKDTVITTYTYYSPVFTTKTEVLQSIRSISPLPLTQTGKIVLYKNFIFINEVRKGVHIIDNSNPAAPVNNGFIAIPGSIDIALKNNTLYADIFTDLIAIDISNPKEVVIKKVLPNVFPELASLFGSSYDSTKYLTNWKKHVTTNRQTYNEALENKAADAISFAQIGNSNSNSQSVSGSMARFTIINNHLYTVGNSTFSAINITQSNNPIVDSTMYLGWNVETIYPFKDKLFIGTQNGMFIFNVANPAEPKYLSSFAHACFDDPVIADDNYAYITLKAATRNCWMSGTSSTNNQLDIVDVTNLQQPSLVKIYPMEQPQGLSKDGNHLFICDGKGGLKIYDASNVNDLKLLQQIKGFNPFDVITISGLAIVIAKEGIYQYDYSNINAVKLLSKINIEK